jgi:hypothetical protein
VERAPVYTIEKPLVVLTRMADFVDSHFHLDKLCERTGQQNLAGLEKQLADPRYLLVSGVANYVFPEYWARAEQALIEEDPRV